MKNETKLPEISQEPVMHIDATPDGNYPLRILRAYRQHCDCYWTTNTGNPLMVAMNKACEERAVILDKAIIILEQELAKDIAR